MALVPTVISASVGDRSMGRPAPNKPDDVRKIQALLRTVLGLAAPVFSDGVCDAKMKAAILEFQRAWGGLPDGTVDPNGQTLARLDRLATPLVLKPATTTWLGSGGYVISYACADKGALPARGSGYTLHLGFPAIGNAIDVTGRPPAGLMSAAHLGALLTIFDNLGCWGTTVQCRLWLKYKGTVVGSSNEAPLAAPVQPHNGRMLPLDEVNNGAKLIYQGNVAANTFYGRMFATVPGFDKNLFIWAGKLETKPENRGFDCITYAGTTCGAANSHMAASDDLATSLGTTEVEHTREEIDPATKKKKTVSVKLEKADPALVKEFFATKPAGYFLMWSAGHVVIVANGEVNEFKASTPAGYARTAVATWLAPYTAMKLTVRRLPGKPARAT